MVVMAFALDVWLHEFLGRPAAPQQPSFDKDSMQILFFVNVSITRGRSYAPLPNSRKARGKFPKFGDWDA